MQVEIMNEAEITPETAEQKLIFPKFTKEEAGVYGVVCPQRKQWIKYGQLLELTLPDRVEEIVRLTEGDFERYELWEAESADIHDPILLGVTQGWPQETYLMARWGKELAPFAELKKKALEIHQRRLTVALAKLQALLGAFNANPALFTEEALAQGQFEVPSLFNGEFLR